MNILFLSPIIPWPQLDGDKQRAFHTLKTLAARHKVWFLGLIRNEAERQALQALRPFCAQAEGIMISRQEILAQAVKTWVSGLPLNVGAFQFAKVSARVRALVAERQIEVIHAYRLRMAPYALDSGAGIRVLDYTDALTRQFQQRCDVRSHWWQQVYLQRETRRLKAYEVAVSHKFDACLISSSQDRDVLLAHGANPGIVEVTNGVETKKFSPPQKLTVSPNLIFVGNLEYAPNQWGLSWFADQVWPRVLAECPSAQLTVVGKKPGGFETSALARMTQTTFAGVVPDLAEKFRQARVAICPVEVASGRQFKVIEYFAAGIPAVITPRVAENLGAKDGQQCLTAAAPEAFAAGIMRLLQNRALADRLRRTARAWVIKTYDWKVADRQLDRLYQRVCGSVRRGK